MLYSILSRACLGSVLSFAFVLPSYAATSVAKTTAAAKVAPTATKGTAAAAKAIPAATTTGTAAGAKAIPTATTTGTAVGAKAIPTATTTGTAVGAQVGPVVNTGSATATGVANVGSATSSTSGVANVSSATGVTAPATVVPANKVVNAPAVTKATGVANVGVMQRYHMMGFRGIVGGGGNNFVGGKVTVLRKVTVGKTAAPAALTKAPAPAAAVGKTGILRTGFFGLKRR
ncbi:Uncharacterised protein [Legionella steigerwaltii]|uniref:Uncharacterized protein n=1 Tax=Legionella steigerwaltii TaxID=460 RepID=A0A378L6S2_9GAMM|nr:hypothetical protein [Legionella steigerwaltii]KTD75378.1 hypothetical protein Lstg_2473 [Legionella steigerwaltii]STY21528.1 Uncharacterised protein [Legionella steigerwaltii]